MFIDYYEILGVELDADLVQITAAWRRLLKKYHPDLNQNDHDANEQTLLINKAYEILSDPAKRKTFDQKLNQRQQKSNTTQASELVCATGKEEASSPNNADNGPFEDKADQSFAETSQKKAKENQFAAIMTIVGILLGAVTAIPIGLFLVWSISGFDPLGIFRQKQQDRLAQETEQQTPKSDEQADKEKVDDNVVAPKIDPNSKAKADHTKVGPNKKITISYAKFGESRQQSRVEKFVQEAANRTGVETFITTEGLKTTNPVGRPREFLRLTYQIDGQVTGTMQFKHSDKIDLRQAILNHAEKHGRTFKPIEITYALFGNGRNQARCEEQVAAVASQINVITPITTHGLSLRNPSGRVRELLLIRYKVGEKTGELTLKYGQQVDLRRMILVQAGVSDGSFDESLTSSNTDPANERNVGSQPPANELTTNEATANEIQRQTDSRLEIPGEKAISNAKKEIGSAFSQRFQEANSENGLERLAKLRDLALEILKLTDEEKDPAVLFSLYEVSIDIGRRSYFSDRILEIVAEFESKFKIDGLQHRYRLLDYWQSELGANIRKTADRRTAAGRLSRRVDDYFAQALSSKRWTMAANFSQLNRKLLSAAGNSSASIAQQNATRTLKQFAQQKQEAAELASDLSNNPDQSEKSLKVGVYYAFVEREWEKAFPYLKSGSDKELAKLVESDMAADDSAASAIADRWMQLARSPRFSAQSAAIYSRARLLYQCALRHVSGLERQKVVQLIVDSTTLMDQKDPLRLVGSRLFSETTGMEFIYVKEGTFTMGEVGAKDFPAHKVEITQPYYLGRYEVTQAEWIKVMGTKPWLKKAHTIDDPLAPASYMNFQEAFEFCKRLSESEGRVYRLPSEAEWEYACRAGTTTKYSWGDSDGLFAEHGWYRKNAWYINEHKFAHKVGLKKPNPWGFCDIHGNVREFCLDFYAPAFYKKKRAIDPLNTAATGTRAIRGGSFYYHDFMGRSAVRFNAPENIGSHDLGLRVLCEISPDNEKAEP